MLKYSNFLFMLFLSCSVLAQSPLVHEKKIYASPDGKIYVNKDQPVYFKVSTSSDGNSKSYVLPSEKSAEYANPMFFDTEGRNTLRSPSAVNKITKKAVQPRQDVLYAIYADGLPPVSRISFSGSRMYKNKNAIFFGKNLKVIVSAKDETSGVETSYMSVNQNDYGDFSSFQQNFDLEKEYSVSYYSVDHVGNAETPLKENFQVDVTPPITEFQVIGDSKGSVLSSKAIISLSSKDTLSGVAGIYYSINGGPEKIYTGPISLSVLKDGNSNIVYYAVDHVGNKETEKVISATTGPMGEDSDRSAYSFYIDKEPPVIGFEIVGDSYKSNHLYISGRSLFKIVASDEKSGVDKTSYSIDNTLLKNNYAEPFAIHSEGIHSVTYAAVDFVGNMAVSQTQSVFLDKTAPQSHVIFEGNKFINRDTLFITDATNLVINVNEKGSGIQDISYNIDGETTTKYSGPFQIKSQGFHDLVYSAKDNVNNSEEVKNSSFYVDNTPPQIITNFSVKAIGERIVNGEKYSIYPSNAMLFIASTDDASGVEGMQYKVNGKVVPPVNPLKGFLPGNYSVEIVSSDVLKNKSSKVLRFTIDE